MNISKVCKHCGATIGAEQEAMVDAMNAHRQVHIDEARKQIESLEKTIEEIEKDEE